MTNNAGSERKKDGAERGEGNGKETKEERDMEGNWRETFFQSNRSML